MPPEKTRPIDDPAWFIIDNTAVERPPLVPEIALHLASETVPLWTMTEEDLAARGLPPPFWAFAWAGGQALARHVLDNPVLVHDKRVLDFGSGSGLVAIAAGLSSAHSVLASDVDPFAAEAITLNAALNGVAVTATSEDLVGRTDLAVDVVCAGDVCYEQPLAGRVEAWLRALAGQGVTVLIGDPGRTHVPVTKITHLDTYRVATSRALEDNAVRRTAVWRLEP